MKLQKLLYYCQAWSLVWDEGPLFKERIEAWANGPVVREIYDHHKGMYSVSSWNKGNVKALSAEQKDTIDQVLKVYGDKPSHWLSALTHSEDPWKIARKGLDDGERGNREITHASMMEYYDSLVSVL
jgi:uncharacterized phage-associated protein